MESIWQSPANSLGERAPSYQTADDDKEGKEDEEASQLNRQSVLSDVSHARKSLKSKSVFGAPRHTKSPTYSRNQYIYKCDARRTS